MFIRVNVSKNIILMWRCSKSRKAKWDQANNYIENQKTFCFFLVMVFDWAEKKNKNIGDLNADYIKYQETKLPTIDNQSHSPCRRNPLSLCLTSRVLTKFLCHVCSFFSLPQIITNFQLGSIPILSPLPFLFLTLIDSPNYGLIMLQTP